MADSTATLYEGLFLLYQSAAGDLAEAVDHVREILNNTRAEILFVRKWDDRKLAYSIHGQKRGLYLLSMFRVSGNQITQIERDCNHSDLVLRVLITRADHLGDVEVEQGVKDAQVTEDEIKLRARTEAVEADAGVAVASGTTEPPDRAEADA